MSNLVTIKKTLTAPAAAAQFKMALPSNISPERFQRVAITAIMQNPSIAECTESSVFNSLMKCAQDGLLPDGREAALVKFGNTAQYMPMVSGIIKRMKNSGEISDLNAHLIYTADKFDYEIKDGVSHVQHKPNMFGDRGKLIGVYGVVLFKDDSTHVEVMTVAEVEAIRERSKSKNSGPWVTDFGEMAKKTVLRRCAKRVPTSSEIDALIDQDVKVSMGEIEDEPAKASLLDSINEAIDMEPVTSPVAQDSEKEYL